MATRDVFSDAELAQLRGFPEITRAELIRYFTLTDADEAFVRKFRGQGNTLGAAVQLCALPWLGFVPDEVRSAPAAAVARLSERLQIPVGALRGYGLREQTRTDHLREVARCLTLATNAIVTWTTEYYGLAIAALRRGGRVVDEEVLAHLWPSHHENVHFYGTHAVDVDRELAKLDADGYRPLRTPAPTPSS